MNRGPVPRPIRAIASLLLLAIPVFPPAAAGSSAPVPGAVDASDDMRIAVQDDIRGLNPFNVSDHWSNLVLGEIYDRAVNVDWKTGSTQPWIAVEWCHGSRASPTPGRCSRDAADDDPLNVTVRYRLGSWAGKWGAPPRFHDGTDVTIDDILFSYAAMNYDPRLASSLRALRWTATEGYDWSRPPYGEGRFQKVTIGAAGGEEGWLSVHTVDDHTLTFSLKRPFPDFFAEVLDVRVLPRSVWLPHLDVQTGTGDFLSWDMGHDAGTGAAPGAVGSGPYRLGRWERTKSVRLQAFPEFHNWTRLPRVDERGRVIQPEAPAYDPAWSGRRPAPRAGGLYFTIYLDINAAALALEQAKVDVVAFPVPPSMRDELQKGEKCTALGGEKTNCGTVIGLQTTRQQAFTYLGFNLRRLPMGYDKWDPKNASSMIDVGKPFRKAVAYSTDKETIVSQILQGYGTVAHSPITPDLPLWYNGSVEKYPLDETEAERQLDAAGWKRDPSCPKVGNPPDHARSLPGVGCAQIDLLTPEAAYEPVCAVWGQMFEAQAQKIGLNVKSIPTAAGKIEDQVSKGDFQMYGKLCRNFPGDVGRRPGAFLRGYYHCGGEDRGNIGGYCDPRVDALLDEHDLTSSLPRRVQIVKEVQGIVMDDLALNPLFFRNATEAYRKDRFVVTTIAPPGWMPSVGGIVNHWSLLLVEHPPPPTELSASGPAKVACGSGFDYDLVYTSGGKPVEGATINASATAPVRVVTSLPVLTDSAGRAVLSFDSDSSARPGNATLRFEASKPGHSPQTWSATVGIGCDIPSGIAISSFTSTPPCVAPGDLARVRAAVVRPDPGGAPMPDAIVRIVYVGGGEIDATERRTDAAGVAEFIFGYPTSPEPGGRFAIELRAKATVTSNGTGYASTKVSLNITVDPAGCRSGLVPGAPDSAAGLAIAAAGTILPALVGGLLFKKSPAKRRAPPPPLSRAP